MENPGQSVDVTNDGKSSKIFCRSLLYPCWVPRSSLVGSSFKPQNLVMASRYQCICPVLAVSIFVPQSNYGSYKDIQVAQHANLLLASFFFLLVCDGAFCKDVLFTFNVAPQNASDGSYRANTSTSGSTSAYDTVWKQTQWWDLDAPQSDGEYELMAIPGAQQVADDQLNVTGNVPALVTAINDATAPTFLKFTATVPTKPLYAGKCLFCIHGFNSFVFQEGGLTCVLNHLQWYFQVFQIPLLIGNAIRTMHTIANKNKVRNGVMMIHQYHLLLQNGPHLGHLSTAFQFLPEQIRYVHHLHHHHHHHHHHPQQGIMKLPVTILALPLVILI
jgi:hypothetical protein